jgi:enoyl-CoA hydratase/carnithine racemase
MLNINLVKLGCTERLMIKKSIDKQILTIEIDRVTKKNALVPQMYNDMAAAIENAQHEQARVILIKGAGGVFTAGNDVAAFVDSVNNGAGDVNETYRFMQALLHCPLPVVAQVEGLAIGIGSTLLLHCDFVFAHADTKFAMPFINLGLVPEYASSYIIPRVGGYLLAAELLMLGEPFDAQKAQRAGLVSSIHGDDLARATTDLCQTLALKPAKALMDTKALLRQDVKAISQHIDDELKIFAAAMQSAPAREAFDAFLEKRAVNYDIFK